jgi:hypothetical protein
MVDIQSNGELRKFFHYRTLLLFVFDRRGAEAQSKATCDMFSHQCFMVISDDFFSAPQRLCGHSKKVCGTEEILMLTLNMLG